MQLLILVIWNEMDRDKIMMSVGRCSTLNNFWKHNIINGQATTSGWVIASPFASLVIPKQTIPKCMHPHNLWQSFEIDPANTMVPGYWISTWWEAWHLIRSSTRSYRPRPSPSNKSCRALHNIRLEYQIIIPATPWKGFGVSYQSTSRP